MIQLGRSAVDIRSGGLESPMKRLSLIMCTADAVACTNASNAYGLCLGLRSNHSLLPGGLGKPDDLVVGRAGPRIRRPGLEVHSLSARNPEVRAVGTVLKIEASVGGAILKESFRKDRADLE